jgi:predicted RNA-binding Zn-ribbon protein involved in translation (DUF1610 family)
MGNEEKEYMKRFTNCPECGTLLIEAPMQTITSQGVGPAHSQHMKGWSEATELVCPKCGLVIRTSRRIIHR